MGGWEREGWRLAAIHGLVASSQAGWEDMQLPYPQGDSQESALCMGVGRLSPSISRQGRGRRGAIGALRRMSTAATERELHALAADSGLSLSPQLLGVVLELLRLDVTPQALLMMLRRVMVRSVELQRAPQ